MEELTSNIDSIVNTGWVGVLVATLLIIAVTAFIARLVTKFLRKALQRGGEKDLPTGSIFVNIGRAAVWFLGICIMLSTCFKVDVSAAIAALGVGGIAISLGLQDTISNLMGGLQLSLLRLIKPGDNITVGSSSGVVLDVTWRHTTIRNEIGDEIVIPNSIINKTALLHLPPLSRISVPIVVATNGDDIDEISERIVSAASKAGAAVGKVKEEPILLYNEIIDEGFKGTVKLTMADSRDSLKAKDAVVRAIAPLTRQHEAEGEDSYRKSGKSAPERAE